MASVFLAHATREPSRLGRVEGRSRSAPTQEAREILESEQRGAELQQPLLRGQPARSESLRLGLHDDYFYIAMEYIAGEDLSQAIHRGQLPWQRAVAITMQLCEFLEEADRFEITRRRRRSRRRRPAPQRSETAEHQADRGRRDQSARLRRGEGALLSRKVTRNDFGSTAYLSPECLESGDRDAHSDAWALGVLLYEMVRGRQPFRADDTRRLEHLIRFEGRPIDRRILPAGARSGDRETARPYPADRYDSPAEILADLTSAHAGRDTTGAGRGWPRSDPASNESIRRRPDGRTTNRQRGG